MRFRLQSSNSSTRNRRSRLVIAITVVVAVLIIVIAARVAPHMLATPLQGLARPVIAVRNVVGGGVDGVLSYFQSKSNLKSQNSALEKEIIFYKAAVAERDYFINQTAQLQKLLGSIGSSTAANFIAASIVSKPNFSPYDTMLVNIGASGGVKANDLVFADQHLLIGYVSSVSALAATITSYSTPGQNVNVLIGSSSIEATAFGLGGGTLEVQLPRNSPVAVGDIVTAAGNTSGNILGRVEVVTATTTDPSERVLFTSPLDIFDLSYVLIKK